MFGYCVRERQLHSQGDLSTPRVLRNRSETKPGVNSHLHRAGQVWEKKTDLEILTSPKGGLHEKYLRKTLEKPQIDDRLKERKKEKKA